MKPIRLAVILSLGTLALALRPAAAPTHAHAQAATVVVTIQNFLFAPATITVAAGTTVVWSNKDTVDHAPTADSGAWDGGDVPPGGSTSVTLSTPGTYPYHCAIHPEMVGTIIVTGSGTAPTATPPPPPTTGSTPVATATPASTAVPSTPTPAATATSTPLPLFVKLTIGHKATKVGAKQSLKVATLPGASVTITVTFPDGVKNRHSGHATSTGAYTWSFKQPAGHTTAKKHTARVAVSATQGSASAKSTGSYTIR